jgi:hypothetical protein
LGIVLIGWWGHQPIRTKGWCPYSFKNGCKMTRFWIIFLGSICFIGCTASKYTIPTAETNIKRIVLLYDQPMRNWPQKGRTDRVVPAIFLPKQQKAFHLYKSEYTKARGLILEFQQDDDSSLVQVLAKCLGYTEWLYVDTIISMHRLQAGNTCYRLQTTTFKTKKYDFVPTLKLVPFECIEGSNPIVLKRYLTYNSTKDSLTGNDPKLYLKNGPNDFFPAIFRRKLPVLKVSDIDE